jgi:hypothetical protein
MMPLKNRETGETRSDAEGRRMIEETIRRTGRFLMDSSRKPQIGEIQTFCGLPMRCIRHVTREEFAADNSDEIWGGMNDDDGPYFFEVEVAD